MGIEPGPPEFCGNLPETANADIGISTRAVPDGAKIRLLNFSLLELSLLARAASPGNTQRDGLDTIFTEYFLQPSPPMLSKKNTLLAAAAFLELSLSAGVGAPEGTAPPSEARGNAEPKSEQTSGEPNPNLSKADDGAAAASNSRIPVAAPDDPFLFRDFTRSPDKRSKVYDYVGGSGVILGPLPKDMTLDVYVKSVDEGEFILQVGKGCHYAFGRMIGGTGTPLKQLGIPLLLCAGEKIEVTGADKPVHVYIQAVHH